MKCRVWAPHAERVALVLTDSGERLPLERLPGGYFFGEHQGYQAGVNYGFSLDEGDVRPDPRSQFQPAGVHGPSQRVNFSSFNWTDDGFQQVPLASAIVYELHVGCFSRSGTFEGVIEHLDHLKRLGITHVELMPVAAFPGQRGWGYDGVLLFAPHEPYGGPHGLMTLVDECHRRGLAVILDVVYNHLGPSGNYLGQYGPYFTDRYATPWGQAVNYDGPGSDEVRRFVCDNALHWLRNYHIDGLRLDAVHAIHDQSATHVLEQLAHEVDSLSAQLGRHFTLIAESNLNDPRFVKSSQLGGYGLSSQWNDDFHHALRTVLTGDRKGYYCDFGQVSQLADGLKHGFVYRGAYSSFRQCSYGRDSSGLQGRHFHVFCQNHDQVGNRALGDRLPETAGSPRARVAAALVLMSPFVPMLFMGEEWGTRSPFQYFTDHAEPELADAVREGRRREFEAFGWDPMRIPDPQAGATFERSRLSWGELDEPHHADLLAWYQKLIELRRSEPSLQDDNLASVAVDFDEQQEWLMLTRGDIVVLVNFSEEPRSLTRKRLALEGTRLEMLLASDVAIDARGTNLDLPATSVAILSKGT